MIIPPNDNWFSLILCLRGSVLSRIWVRLMVTIGFSVGLTVVWATLDLSLATITTIPFSLVGVALAVFLGFRNNTSYDRYWEGRRMWSQVHHCCRVLTRQMHSHIAAYASQDGELPRCDDATVADVEETRQRLTRRLLAFPHLLRGKLRSDDVSRDVLRLLSGEKDLEKITPQSLLHDFSAELQRARRKGYIHINHLPMLESSLTELSAADSSCVRIQSTPIPFAYRVLLHRIVASYCLALPFGIIDSVGYFTPVVVVMIAYAFYGLDAIGDELQDPFGNDANDLPLTYFSQKIENELFAYAGFEDAPPIATTKNGVLT